MIEIEGDFVRGGKRRDFRTWNGVEQTAEPITRLKMERSRRDSPSGRETGCADTRGRVEGQQEHPRGHASFLENCRPRFSPSASLSRWDNPSGIRNVALPVISRNH